MAGLAEPPASKAAMSTQSAQQKVKKSLLFNSHDTQHYDIPEKNIFNENPFHVSSLLY